VPLSAKGRVAGLIEAFCTEPFGFNDSEVRSLKLLAELILAAVRLEEETRLAQLSEPGLPAPVLLEPKLAPPEPTQPEVTRPKIVVDEKPSPDTAKLQAKAAVMEAPPAEIDPGASPSPTPKKPEAEKVITIPSLPQPTLNLRADPIEAPGSRPT